MMRRGPLDRYPVASVLQQAGAQGVSGSIELHTTAPITVYLHNGKVYAVAEGVEIDPSGHGSSEEDEARTAAVGHLATVLDRNEGWYYLDPLADHPSRGAWGWDMGPLLAEAATSRADRSTSVPSTTETAPPARPQAGPDLDRSAAGPAPDRTVALGSAPGPSVTLGADAWAVVTALAAPAAADEIAATLGWTSSQVDAALADLQGRGLLLDEAPPRGGRRPAPPPRSPTSDAPAAGPLAAPPAGLPRPAPAAATDPAPPSPLRVATPSRREQRRAAAAALDGGSLGRAAPSAPPDDGTAEGAGRRRRLGRRGST